MSSSGSGKPRSAEDALLDLLNSFGGPASDLGKNAFDALEGLLQQADANAPTEEMLKDFAREHGITFGDEDEKHGR
jgi:hypothetical protein